jgi:hypothetical protein
LSAAANATSAAVEAAMSAPCAFARAVMRPRRAAFSLLWATFTACSAVILADSSAMPVLCAEQ